MHTPIVHGPLGVQGSLHAPQCETLVPRSASQPFVASPSQSAKLPLHNGADVHGEVSKEDGIPRPGTKILLLSKSRWRYPESWTGIDARPSGKCPLDRASHLPGLFGARAVPRRERDGLQVVSQEEDHMLKCTTGWKRAMLFPWAVLALTATSAGAAALQSWDKVIPNGATRFKVLSQLDGEAVLDKETGLTWQRSPSPTNTSDWGSSAALCIGTAIGGRRGWRLPSAWELMTLKDPAQSNPALPPGHPFQGIVTNTIYWTSTASLTSATSAHAVNFASGGAGIFTNLKTVDGLRWCVGPAVTIPERRETERPRFPPSDESPRHSDCSLRTSQITRLRNPAAS